MLELGTDAENRTGQLVNKASHRAATSKSTQGGKIVVPPVGFGAVFVERRVSGERETFVTESA